MVTQVSFFDKIKALVDVSSTSPYFIGIIVLFILLAILFTTTNKDNSKKSKIVYLIVYIGSVAFILIKYGTSLKSLWDYLVNHFFILFYFPNLTTYLIGIIITNIILWKTLFKEEVEKTLKVVNSIIYCLLHYILILILNVIATKQLDILSEGSVYQNKQALSLIELSSAIFITWLIFIVIFLGIRKFQNRNMKEYKVEAKEQVNSDLKINFINAPGFIYSKQKQEKNVVTPIVDEKEPDAITTLIGSIQTNTVDTMKPVFNELEMFDKLFTLEDYKILLNMLKQKSYKEKNIKEHTTSELKEKNQSGITELEALYRK